MSSQAQATLVLVSRLCQSFSPHDHYTRSYPPGTGVELWPVPGVKYTGYIPWMKSGTDYISRKQVLVTLGCRHDWHDTNEQELALQVQRGTHTSCTAASRAAAKTERPSKIKLHASNRRPRLTRACCGGWPRACTQDGTIVHLAHIGANAKRKRRPRPRHNGLEAAAQPLWRRLQVRRAITAPTHN